MWIPYAYLENKMSSLVFYWAQVQWQEREVVQS